MRCWRRSGEGDIRGTGATLSQFSRRAFIPVASDERPFAAALFQGPDESGQHTERTDSADQDIAAARERRRNTQTIWFASGLICVWLICIKLAKLRKKEGLKE